MGGIDPNVVTYSAAISACGKSGQWKTALLLLKEMRGADLTPNVITYSAAISACEKGGQREKALSLLKQMRGLGLKSNAVTGLWSKLTRCRSRQDLEALEQK